MKKVLIAPNSFKECADSVTIARLMEESITEMAKELFNKEISAVLCPISDGGDGFLGVLGELFNLKFRNYKISTPWGEGEIISETGYDEDSKILYIESANVIGLKHIPNDKRHPLKLSSRGLGELLGQIELEVRTGQINLNKVIIGIGGTGTCDFGLGMCSALGLEIFDQNGLELSPFPENFCKASRIEWNERKFPFEIETVLDVSSPLLGKNGSSRGFAPQKGATDKEVEILEEGITNYLSLLNEKYPEKKDYTLYGAGGGIAAALHYFFKAKYKLSRDFVHDYLMKSLITEEFDLIITGEGGFDDLTYFNKGAMIIIEEFINKNIPIFICAGSVQRGSGKENVKDLHFIDISNYFSDKEDSIRNIRLGIKLAMKDVLNIYFSGKIST